MFYPLGRADAEVSNRVFVDLRAIHYRDLTTVNFFRQISARSPQNRCGTKHNPKALFASGQPRSGPMAGPGPAAVGPIDPPTLLRDSAASPFTPGPSRPSPWRHQMARIIGNIKPEDDFTHALGEEPNFNESMYFNFFDPKKSLGGFVRLGNRANEGRAEMTVCLFLADGRVLFSFNRAQIDHNDAFDAGGMRFEVLEPSEKLRTTYQGKVIELKNARELSDPARAFQDSPRRTISLDLEHTACGPMYGSSKSGAEEKRKASEQFGKAHYEQHMSIQGQLTIEGEVFEINGLGLRDHSWGPRHWQAIYGYEWLTINFSPDFGAMVSVIRRDPESEKKGGVIIRGDEFILIKDVSIETEFEANGLYHKSLNVMIETHEGEKLQVRGDVENFIPLRNRRAGLQTHIGEGMTRWQCGDQVGYGLSEYLRQVD